TTKGGRPARAAWWIRTQRDRAGEPGDAGARSGARSCTRHHAPGDGVHRPRMTVARRTPPRLRAAERKQAADLRTWGGSTSHRACGARARGRRVALDVDLDPSAAVETSGELRQQIGQPHLPTVFRLQRDPTPLER